jgi:hypothetical protein
LKKTQDIQIITNSVFDIAVFDASDDSDDPTKIEESRKHRQDQAKALKKRQQNLAACDEPTSWKEPEEKPESRAKKSSRKLVKNRKATDKKENKKRDAETKPEVSSAEDDDHNFPPPKKPCQVRGLTTKAGQSEFLEHLSEKGLQAKQEELKVSGMHAEAQLAKFGGMTPEQRRFQKGKAAQEERQKNEDRALERAKPKFKTQELHVRQLEAQARIEESKGETFRGIFVFEVYS